MELFSFPMVESDDFKRDKKSDAPAVVLGSINDHIMPITIDELLRMLSQREIELPAERLEILNYL